MLILSVDTTATVCSAALRRDGKTLGECTVNSGNTHSVTLLPMIEQLLKFCSAALDDIDVYAASVGPGSFTGVRIGTAAVKGLAYKTMFRACLYLHLRHLPIILLSLKA